MASLLQFVFAPFSRTELMKSEKFSHFHNKRKYKHVHAMISKSKDEILIF